MASCSDPLFSETVLRACLAAASSPQHELTSRPATGLVQVMCFHYLAQFFDFTMELDVLGLGCFKVSCQMWDMLGPLHAMCPFALVLVLSVLSVLSPVLAPWIS